ncbi:MAG: lytic transglycosylase domain-containing protein [Bacteroidales bacterium]
MRINFWGSLQRKFPYLTYIGLAVVVIITSLTAWKIISEPGDDDFILRSGMTTVAVPLPKKMSFAGEPVPLNLFYVREALDRELTLNTYWHSQSIMLFKRAHRFFSVIEPILKKQGIPSDFKYLILVESGFLHDVSPAGAAGYWQFLPETAKELGLEVNDKVDERYDLEKSTLAFCKFIKKAYEKYGSWTTAAAAFNGGMGRFDRITGIQKTSNYYEMYMNSETSRYVFRILAFKLIFEHPQRYGYVLRKEDLYPSIPFKRITINQSIPNLVQWAREQGINYRILRELNPWIRDTQLVVNPGKVYSLKVAAGKFADYDALLRESVNSPDSSK